MFASCWVFFSGSSLVASAGAGAGVHSASAFLHPRIGTVLARNSAIRHPGRAVATQLSCWPISSCRRIAEKFGLSSFRSKPSCARHLSAMSSSVGYKQSDVMPQLRDSRITFEDIATFPRPGCAAPDSIAFSPDDSVVTYLASADGSLTRQLYAMDIATGEVRPIPVARASTARPIAAAPRGSFPGGAPRRASRPLFAATRAHTLACL